MSEYSEKLEAVFEIAGRVETDLAELVRLLNELGEYTQAKDIQWALVNYVGLQTKSRARQHLKTIPLAEQANALIRKTIDV